MVTQAMWEDVMEYNPSDYKGDNIPVNNVSYTQIREFLKKLTDLTSIHCGYQLQYNLMTEWEWKSAAGEQTNVFKDSGNIVNVGLSTGFCGLSIWCNENSFNRAHEVALTAPNEYGLYDMYGNMWEICTGSIPVGPVPQRCNYDNELAYRRALLKWRLLNKRDAILLKGGAWNMPKESCVKETFLEIGENDKFSNAGFRLTVSIQKI